jgi:hypothetical protein
MGATGQNAEPGWDLAIINANADRLNREAIDRLKYQRLS